MSAGDVAARRSRGYGTVDAPRDRWRCAASLARLSPCRALKERPTLGSPAPVQASSPGSLVASPGRLAPARPSVAVDPARSDQFGGRTFLVHDPVVLVPVVSTDGPPYFSVVCGQGRTAEVAVAHARGVRCVPSAGASMSVWFEHEDAHASSKSGEPISAMAVNGPCLGSSADGKGEEGIDRSFERTGTPMYLGE